MDISGIRMPALPAAISSGPASGVKGAAGSGGFADLLKQSIERVNSSQGQAESVARQFQLGQNDVALEDAMIAMQKANISFQAAVQVRNKVVAAYNDIMNMPL